MFKLGSGRKKFQDLSFYWQERSAFQSVNVQAMMLMANISDIIFFLLFSPIFSPFSTFLIKGVPRSKVNISAQKLLSRPHRPYFGPLGAILDSAGWWGGAGGEQVPLAPLGWYFRDFVLNI